MSVSAAILSTLLESIVTERLTLRRSGSCYYSYLFLLLLLLLLLLLPLRSLFRMHTHRVRHLPAQSRLTPPQSLPHEPPQHSILLRHRPRHRLYLLRGRHARLLVCVQLLLQLRHILFTTRAEIPLVDEIALFLVEEGQSVCGRERDVGVLACVGGIVHDVLGEVCRGAMFGEAEYAAPHCSVLYCTVLGYAALQCTALHYRPKRVRGTRAIQSQPIEAGDLVLICLDSISPWLA